MCRFLIVVAVIFLNTISFAQKQDEMTAKPRYRYIYSITKEEALQISEGKYKAVFTDAFLKKAVDSLLAFQYVPSVYNKGGYISVFSEGKQINIDFLKSQAVNVDVVTTPFEQGLVVEDVVGRALSDVLFYTKTGAVNLMFNGYYYVIPKYLYGERIIIEYNAEFVLAKIPLKLKQNVKSKKLYSDNSKKSFVLTDKPKYHVGDTVYVKGYLPSSLFKKQAVLSITYAGKSYSRITVKKEKLTKDVDGSYLYSFVIPDSLPIDKMYSIKLSQKSNFTYCSFSIEDYYLNDFLLQANVAFGAQNQDSVSINIQYETPQGSPVDNGWIYLKLEPLSAYVNQQTPLYLPSVFIQDSIQVAGTDYVYKNKIPALPKGEYKLKLTVQARSNGNVVEIKKNIAYDIEPVVITHTVVGSKFTFEAFNNGKPIDKGFALYKNQSTYNTVAITFPYVVDIEKQALPNSFRIDNANMALYDFESTEVFIYEQNKTPATDIRYSIQNNKIQLHVQNTFELKLSIANAQGDLLCESGEADILLELPLQKKQLLYCEYLFKGKYVQKYLLISPDYNALLIDAELPDTISPGQSYTGKVSVSQLGKGQVKNANLTALAVDSRLVNKSIPKSVQTIKYEYKDIPSSSATPSSALYFLDSAVQKRVYTDYYNFLYKDSINYFLIPEYDTSLTEAFLYAEEKGGYNRPVYIYEDGKLVYCQATDVISSQSFYTRPGYHSYEVRLSNKTFHVDSIYIYSSYKNNILIHIDRLAKSQLQKRPHHFTSKEVEKLHAILYTFEGLTYEEHVVTTRSNLYHFSNKNKVYVLSGDSDFNTSENIEKRFIISKADVSPEKKQYTYLKRQYFKALKPSESFISIAELKKLEEKVFVNVRKPYVSPAKSFNLETNRGSIKYALLYVHESLFDHSYMQLVDDKKNTFSAIEMQYGVVKFELDSGNYQLRVLDSLGGIISEQKIEINKRGHYVVCVYSKTRLNRIQKDSLDKIYGKDLSSYPSSARHSKPKPFALNYAGFFGGINMQEFSSIDVNPGYQFGGFVGHQFMKSHWRYEFRGLYGKSTASNVQLGEYRYARVGMMTWVSLFKFEKLYRRRPTLNAYIGTGVQGQYIFTSGLQTFGLSIPVGTALQYKFSPRFDLGLEAIWNASVFGTDYSNVNGTLEVNLRLHINVNGHHVYKARYKNQSYLLSKGGTYYSKNDIKTSGNATYADTTKSYSSAKPITERVRSDFYDRAYWIPSFKTNAAGTATFNARYPDALTQWDNYIVAIKGRKLNTWQSQTTTYMKDYVQLYVPRFAIKGDSLSASYHVHSDLPVTIVNEVGGKLINKSANADSIFSFYASETIDTIRCSTSLFSDGKLIDGERRIIPLYHPGSEVYTGTYTYLKGDTLIYIHKPDSMLEASIYVSESMHDLVGIQYKHLMEYPYNCNEQTASKLIASVYEKQFSENYKGKHPQDFYLKLRKNLNYENMYGWWKDCNTDLSMTAYVYYALTIYYKKATLTPDKFYVDLGKALSDEATKEKVSHFTYWLMKESGLSVSNVSISRSTETTIQSEILDLRIRQLRGEMISRKEIVSYLDSTMLGNTTLQKSGEFSSDWYANDMLYLLLLHKISKVEYPDIAENIRKGIIEKGGLSLDAPTYIKALFIDECINIQEVSQSVKDISYDNTTVQALPFIKNISDTSVHVLNIKDATGMYVVNSTKQMQTKEIRYTDLDVNYLFKDAGVSVSVLKSGHMVDQIVTLTVKKTSGYVMLEIPIAAGCMVEGITASNSFLLVNKEVYRDKIILYFEQLQEGTYTFNVREKVLFKGNYQLNQCSVRLMYFPMIQTQTALKRIVIE